MSEVVPAGDGLTYCEVHPDRETSLRCNKCGRLMCTECAVLTPVGYRCRECVRGQQERPENDADARYRTAIRLGHSRLRSSTFYVGTMGKAGQADAPAPAPDGDPVEQSS